MKYLLTTILLFKLIINFSYGDIPKHDWPHEVSDLKPDSRIIYGKLENGFRYIFMPNAKPSKHFSVRLYVNVGSLNEEKHEQGLAHFLEHMAFKGIRGYPGDEMIQTLQDLGVPFGSHSNAHTGIDETVYKLDFRNNSAENLQHTLRIMSGIADGMVLDEELIKKEIGVILAEKRDRHDTQHKLDCDFRKFIANGLLHIERLPLGLESVIKSANTELLKNFYKKWYRPERMILIVVGDLNQHDVESGIKENFATFSDLLEEGTEPNLGSLKHTQGLRTRVYKDKELVGTRIELMSLTPYQPEIPDKNAFKKSICKSLASEIFDERMQELTSPSIIKGGFRRHVWYDMFGFSSISITCRPEQTFEALSSAENELRRVFEYGFTDEEFDRIKRKTLYAWESSKNLDETQETTDLIENLLHATITKDIFTTNQWDYEFLKAFLENEANKEACLEIFKNFWDMENILIYLCTDSDNKYTEDQLKEAYLSSKEMTLEAPKEQKVLKYHYNGLGEPGTITHEQYNADLDCYQYRFSNNVRVNLKQTNCDKSEIVYQINFGNGEDEPGSKLPGITAVAIDIFNDGGIGQFSKEELLKAFHGSGVEIPQLAVDDDSFLINSSITPGDFEAQMNLVCGYLMEPAYRSDRLQQTRIATSDYYHNLNETLDGILKLEVHPYLTYEHPDYQLDELDALIARTPQEVQDWLKDALAESYLEISIVGDFDKDQVLESLLKTLGALPQRRDNKQCYEESYALALREGPVKKVFSYYSTLSQAYSRVYWRLPDSENREELIIQNAKATILSKILDERLRQKVRLELGEGYSPFSGLDFGGKAIMADAITDPEKANYLCELMVEIAETVALDGVTEDEFNQAILTQLLEMESKMGDNNKLNNYHWLERLAQSQEYPFIVQNKHFIDLSYSSYKNLKLEEVNEAAKEYLQAKKALQIIIVPDSYRRMVEEIIKGK